MLQTIEELRSLLSSASDQQSQLETQMAETAATHRDTLLERDEVIRQLKTEVETCEEQLQIVAKRGELGVEG